ncbi:magnesium transporter [Erythrobacter sp. T5W1-R]|uniref:magnesium transporter n=1 Tax=Erythrobacter sp. T5W1-R TaxID=3101752 RepID=UPI002AFE3A8E|nr:magnesium transporter [Erythrobacter sp. T5W1-R]MEA1617775.1 magnesium transporter [Erythrobacter sp. T5W1-R]
MAEDRILEDDLHIAETGEAEVRPDDRVDDERLDSENRLKADYVSAIREALDAGDKGTAYDLVEPLHPADIADLIELLDRPDRTALIAAITDLMTGDVIAELNDFVREDLMEALPPEAVATIAEQLDTDDAVQLIEDLDEADQRAVIAELEPETREAVASALAYPEETAGRLMSRHFVAVPEHLTVGDLIDYLREEGDLEHEFYEVFVIDEFHRPVGTCALNWVLTSPRNIRLTDVMKRDQTLIPVTMDQEEVALMFQKYALISAAVVDDAGRLVGQMTVDDIVHIISEEAGEDALLLSGAGDGDINEPIRESYKARVRWLLANLLTASVASSVISQFEDTIAAMVALAVLMPIVAGIGGNAGTQTLAVTVRALATNQLTASNTWRAVRRELSIAALNGTTVAVVIALAVSLIFANVQLGIVIGLAMACNILIAGFAGVFVPLTLQKMKADPAIASSIFVTMTTDSMGFLVFLGLAVASGLVS